MKNNLKNTLILGMVLSLLFMSCASTTTINSVPQGAKVYIDGQPVGRTPYIYSDTKIVLSETSIRLVKDGYRPFNTYMYRDEKADVGAIVGGFFFVVPFLWTLEYNPVHTYELEPLTDNNRQSDSSSTDLHELKGLLEKGLISPVEYERAKKKLIGI